MKNEPISQPDAAPLDPAASIALGLATQLAQSCATIESRFSGTGDRLTECAMRLNEVSAAHEGLPGALDSADFASAEASLASISRELAHFGESDGSEDDEEESEGDLSEEEADDFDEDEELADSNYV